MAVDTSNPAIKQAIDGIRDPNNEENWVILTHVGTTPKIRVLETGFGFDDFMDELDHSKILYCYMRFDINAMNKYLFVSWCGDGIQDQMFKGKYGSFQREMERFMKGYYHVHINARSEDDLEEDDIKERLKVATGSLYALQSNKRDLTTDEAKKNIMTKKPEIVARDKSITINQEASAKFWEQQQKEAEEEERQQQQQRQRSKPDNVSNERNAFWQKQEQEKRQEEGFKGRQARQSELTNIQSESKNFWQQQEQQQEEKSKPREVPVTSSKATEATSSLRSHFEKLAMEEQQQESEKAARPAPKPVRKFPPVQEDADSRPSPPVFAKPQPEQQQEEYYEEPEQQQEEYYEEPEQQQEEYYEEPQQQEEYYEEPQQQEEYYEEPQQQQEYYEESEQQQEEYYEEPEQQQEEGEYKIAVALFDFESDDPEELPFAEGESLYVLNEDGDWWLAQNGDGRQGFVPANYLEA